MITGNQCRDYVIRIVILNISSSHNYIRYDTIG